MRTPGFGLRRRNSTSGVLPIAWTMSPYLSPQGRVSRPGSNTSESVVRCRAVLEGNVLLTGYPGFIGRRLADRLVEAGARVTALVEPRMAGAAREASGGRVEVVEGDIAQRRLGLADPDWDRLTAEVRHVFHLAAVYDLSVPLELAQRVNVDGTGNVLELCRACERLERLNYVSTAYVAGVRRGVVYEHELTLGQGFKNHYESTKFQAEVWVRQELDRVPTTIYRPAIVVGDSLTGETLNMVDPEPVTAAELLRILAEAYAGRGPSYRLPSRMVEAALRVPAVRQAFGGAPRESIVYLNHPVRFDVRRASDVLGGAAGLRVPRFAEYAPALVRFFREHEDEPRFQPGRSE